MSLLSLKPTLLVEYWNANDQISNSFRKKNQISGLNFISFVKQFVIGTQKPLGIGTEGPKAFQTQTIDDTCGCGVCVWGYVVWSPSRPCSGQELRRDASQILHQPELSWYLVKTLEYAIPHVGRIKITFLHLLLHIYKS